MARVQGRRSLDDPPADEREVSAAASRTELARHRPQQQPASSERRNGFSLFTVSGESTSLTLNRVKQHEDEP